MYQYLLIDKNITPLSHFHNVITGSSFFDLHVQVNAIFCHTETSQSIYSLCFVSRQYFNIIPRLEGNSHHKHVHEANYHSKILINANILRQL